MSLGKEDMGALSTGKAHELLAKEKRMLAEAVAAEANMKATREKVEDILGLDHADDAGTATNANLQKEQTAEAVVAKLPPTTQKRMGLFMGKQQKRQLAEVERKRLAVEAEKEREATARREAQAAARAGLMSELGIADNDAAERELWNLGWDLKSQGRAVVRGRARLKIAAAAVQVATQLSRLEKAKRGEGKLDMATCMCSVEEAETALENEKQDAALLEWQLQEAQDKENEQRATEEAAMLAFYDAQMKAKEAAASAEAAAEAAAAAAAEAAAAEDEEAAAAAAAAAEAAAAAAAAAAAETNTGRRMSCFEAMRKCSVGEDGLIKDGAEEEKEEVEEAGDGSVAGSLSRVNSSSSIAGSTRSGSDAEPLGDEAAATLRRQRNRRGSAPALGTDAGGGMQNAMWQAHRAMSKLMDERCSMLREDRDVLWGIRLGAAGENRARDIQLRRVVFALKAAEAAKAGLLQQATARKANLCAGHFSTRRERCTVYV